MSRAGADRTFEPFVHLVDVTDSAALVAWGGFFLVQEPEGWRVVDDEEIEPERRPSGTIGARSAPYGEATVEVLDDAGRVVASASTTERNHVWVEGLEPDTSYRYRVVVDGEPWAEGERRDWVLEPGGQPGAPRNVGRRYDLRLRTHPPADEPVPVTFLALGDYGVGINHGENGRRQDEVARTLEHLAATHPVRFVVSLGDNIYHRPGDELKQTGDEDDDWYLTFYQPYRYLIDHLPVYPAAGNHDGSDEEDTDDRAQLADNFHLDERFGPGVDEGRASLDPGLFYRLRVGALLELLCLDTTWGEQEGVHYFDDEKHRRWLEEALPDRRTRGDGPTWRIPFAHHPSYCAGPHHHNMEEQIDRVVPLYRRAGVRLVLSGHEHNYQHSRVDGIDYVVAGAGAKLREEPPDRCEDAGTVSWAVEPHCLLVQVDAGSVTVTPWGPSGPGGDPRPIQRRAPDGSAAQDNLVVS